MNWKTIIFEIIFDFFFQQNSWGLNAWKLCFKTSATLKEKWNFLCWLKSCPRSYTSSAKWKEQTMLWKNLVFTCSSNSHSIRLSWKWRSEELCWENDMSCLQAPHYSRHQELWNHTGDAEICKKVKLDQAFKKNLQHSTILRKTEVYTSIICHIFLEYENPFRYFCFVLLFPPLNWAFIKEKGLE